MNAHLETYLNDHLAGSDSALDLLTRLEEKYANMTLDLAEVRAEVQEDQKELKTIMARLVVKKSQSRQVSGWLKK
jgi:capsule polysaccharide export protein KpsE/RkpR